VSDIDKNDGSSKLEQVSPLSPLVVAVWLSGNALVSINVVILLFYVGHG